MKNKQWLLMAAAAGTVVSASMNSIHAQCNTVDAVTSASFKITGGQACDTTAYVNWTFTKSNGTLNIRWGTTTAYGPIVDLRTGKGSSGSNTAGKFTMSPLLPLTKYYYAVDGVYKGKSYTYTRSSFTTTRRTTNSRPVFSRAPNVVYMTIGHTQIVIPCPGEKYTAISLFRCSGTLVMKQTVDITATGEVSFRDMNPGAYLVKISTRTSTITKKIIIER